jgi:thiamine pyrophosphate-dependent acetolactate synthase large subunit-like protein
MGDFPADDAQNGSEPIERKRMRGRRVLMESFVSHDVRHIFGNPGTTETPLLDSLPASTRVHHGAA